MLTVLNLDAAALFVVGFVVPFFFLVIVAMRWARHPAPPSDLKPADDADREALPTPEQLDRIMEAMDETGPRAARCSSSRYSAVR
jgi:hypothetical protein